ncbi:MULTISPECIES: NAD(P)-dependent alcohol dehydrogenase [Yimella]|uniref:alcohol dehydrogenase (NADP(+)) n=1 Tax=Yimella lutea TaxID=587872 RepID=A0A542EIF2_9MICO|nr:MULTISPECIES: NAD(P)-dependent alcohol dehydrogenase [Yimella]MCG8655054.1 NAD(P)-dependent alcohol dehydrogenase [Yimella sp. NH-Cas1]RYG76295.1 NAD(P)-dependent alcohol dehydrogenase [Yimella sp. RIT 621]TQJ15105.1 putative zinc-type alcohol dehydrogenase-like protein [Yimella lutea]
MTTQTPALAVTQANGSFETISLDRRALRDDDIRIDIKFAGICHSDIHTVRQEWGDIEFPITPGHEIAGVVSAVGDGVTKYKVGDRVGVGCMVDSCGECENCKNDHEQFCTKPAVFTYNSLNYDGERAQGGYAQQIVVTERFACRIPDEIGLDAAAPLLCAGITTYSPLKRWGARPGTKVGIVGVGGLGHLGVKIAAAMGAQVYGISRSMAKAEDSEALGATAHLATSDERTFSDHKRSFDIILNTVSADLPMFDYMKLLKPFGVMVNVGLPNGTYELPPRAFSGNTAMAGSMIGGIAETQEMLDFCAEHGIGATIETISADQVDEAYERVVDGDVRYRFVIDTATIGASEKA